MLEAICEVCGETFNPDNEQDVGHYVNSKGVYCGGHGEIKGEYIITPHMGYALGLQIFPILNHDLMSLDHIYRGEYLS